jgi:predicted DNA binding protein
MAVIAHLRIPADSFELGRVLEMESGTAITLENLVPLGEKAIPYFSVSEEARDSFEEAVRTHPSVDRIEMVTRHENETLYALEWDAERDAFFQGVRDLGGQLLRAEGSSKTWEFEIRFSSHELLSEFQEYCNSAHIELEVGRLYNPSKPGSGMWYGLTRAQREALMIAVRGGYYSIPRTMSTQDIATELGISGQAVTERLRRAIETLTENSLIAMEEAAQEDFTGIELDSNA